MIDIYHNARCSKSRMGIAFLDEKNIDYQVIDYLKEISTIQLEELLIKLNMKPIELIRKNETIWKQEYKDKDLTDDQIIEAMITYPKLIERPIVVNGEKAVIGRPTEKILEVL